MSMRRPPQRDVTSLVNWLDGTAALARDETQYLNHARDLVSLGPTDDSLFSVTESLVEDSLIRYSEWFRTVSRYTISNASRDDRKSTLIRLRFLVLPDQETPMSIYTPEPSSNTAHGS